MFRNNEECNNTNRFKRNDEDVNYVTDVSRSNPSLIDNIPLFLSRYLILGSLSINTLNLENYPLSVITLKKIDE